MHSIQSFTKPINRYPSCVYFKLNVDILTSSHGQHGIQFRSVLAIDNQDQDQYGDTICLRLTIRFGREKIKVAGGSIWFGLKRGELRLKLANAIIPIEKQGLTAHFENECTLEVQQENSNEIEGGTSISGITSLTAKAKGIRKKSLKATYKSYSVYTGGTECDPVWIFEAQSHESILNGQISNVSLGDVRLSFSKPYTIAASFVVRGQQDIFLADAEGLWNKDIGRNKLAILERELFLRFIAPKLKPYLSFTEIDHGN